jgi:hypothetical protein
MVLAALVWLAAQEPVAVVQAATEEFRVVRVEVVGFDEAALLAALRLRMPRQVVEPHGGPPPTETPHVYVRVVREPDGVGLLKVITSAGRGYERRFVIEVGQEVRVAASTAANLVFAIEQGAVAPDLVDVAIPETASPEPVKEPEPEPGPVKEPVAAPVVPPTPKPAPQPIIKEAAPGWELALGLHGAAVLGVAAPSHGGVFAGGGGGIGAELRGGRGGALALDVRGLGRGSAAFTVGRVRVGVAGGYVWRRGRFELPAFIGATIEPWWAGAQIYSGAAAVTRSPLIGGYVRVTPALRLEVNKGALAGVRVGPRVELAGSFAVDGGARVVGLADTTGQSMVRLGGLELVLGLEATFEFSLRR